MMSEREIERLVEEAMGDIRESDAMQPKHASREDSKAFLRDLIGALEMEIESLGL